jgi:type IV pilus assembly protein PilM
MRFAAVFRDPPPSLAFEVSGHGIAMARVQHPVELSTRTLPAGVLSISPVHDNVLQPDDLAAAVRELVPPGSGRKRRDAALILPDYCARVAVLDFDNFPKDAAEQSSLVRFRLKKSVPFDVESAALSFAPQPAEGKRVHVVVVAAPVEIVARYEAPFRAAGLNPGLVTISSLAALDLVRGQEVSVVAKLTGGVLTVLVIEKERLKLIRSLELSAASLADIAADLYPTFVYIEDSLGVKAQKLLLCGFETLADEAGRRFEADLGVAVEPVRSALKAPGQGDAGLLGYLQSVSAVN